MKKLTGRTRFRAAEIVQLELTPAIGLVWQVENVEVVQGAGPFLVNRYEWRDGQVEDLCEINHIVYSQINVTVELPVHDTLPGEKVDARKLH
jgi:hypothetical protein